VRAERDVFGDDPGVPGGFTIADWRRGASEKGRLISLAP